MMVFFLKWWRKPILHKHKHDWFEMKLLSFSLSMPTWSLLDCPDDLEIICKLWFSY
ncbi:hypothetical protein SLEP1_g31380 [Rubroshorea leprosula]|uniref:Uncharacterized protein n=1 Tax=Rubroshorea leprosula TaxID=152421 RepID=A0AAV5K890_9ROSI|nr:hypothetical protein SLEP1_g31380 [Rubroshorea leprosula]